MLDFGRGLRRVATWVALGFIIVGLSLYDGMQWALRRWDVVDDDD